MIGPVTHIESVEPETLVRGILQSLPATPSELAAIFGRRETVIRSTLWNLHKTNKVICTDRKVDGQFLWKRP